MKSRPGRPADATATEQGHKIWENSTGRRALLASRGKSKPTSSHLEEIKRRKWGHKRDQKPIFFIVIQNMITIDLTILIRLFDY
jgi:hypothetical protein